jgi:translation initiation factor 4A
MDTTQAFENQETIVETKPYEVISYNDFESMNLPDTLLRSIFSYGFEKPSAIQSVGIAPMVQNHDVIAQAQSGTGKTGTFCIGAISNVDPAYKGVQVIVFAPVRELAQQIEYVAKHLCEHNKVKVYSATGGTPVREDIQAIRNGAQFLVGTPGRIFDLLNRENLIDRGRIKYLVFDEADQLLSDKFRDQCMEILKLGFPPSVRVALFSATMPDSVREFSDNLLQNPVRILLPPEQVTLDGIKQYYVEIEREEWKFDVLCDIYAQLNITQAIIYCNRRQRAEWLAQKMKEAGFSLECIHGDMEVRERKRRMDEFRKGGVRVLISTDMLARGIDVQQISLVINFELPQQKENYIHRIGRSGRYGKKGVSINLIDKNTESAAQRDICEFYRTNIQELPNDLARLI